MTADALEVVQRALAEDLGEFGDVTTRATVPPGATARARLTQKAPGVISGLDAAEAAFRAVDPELDIERHRAPGEFRDPPAPVMTVEGSAASILSAERTALNLLQRLSGVATLTRRYVDAVAGTGAQVIDTRKTTPGLRLLEKQAVLDGGGANHRIGLFDMVLIKENHIAAAGGIAQAVRSARELAPGLPLEIEVRDLDELEQALAAGAPRILLDNMTPAEMAAAVRRVGDAAETEASGGISLETVRAAAETGVTYVSVGALTHSAPALDISLILEPLP